MKTNHDILKDMFKTIRTINESKTSKRTINEVAEFESPMADGADQKQEDDVMVINDVDVKMLSTDKADMVLMDDQKNAISQIIDAFRQQVSEIVDFEPGITINQDQIRLDGSLTDDDITFVFIAGKEAGVYINADMMRLEQDVATVLEKLAKFADTFKTSMEPLITQRNNN
jgi:hypothetical protein